LAKLATRVAKRVCRVGDFTDTSLSGAVYPKKSETLDRVLAREPHSGERDRTCPGPS